MLKIKNRGDPCKGIASILYFHSKSPVFTQNRTAGKLKLLPMERPTSYSPPSPFFLFPFLLLLLFPFFPLLLSSSLSALFSLPLSLPLPFLPPPLYHHGTDISPPLFVTPFFCCGSSIFFQHEPAHFSTTKGCGSIYRIPFRRLDTTLRADQSSRRSTLHPS